MDFKTINQKINEYLLNHPVKDEALVDKNYKLQLSDALFCARDEIRNHHFFKAIQLAVKQLKERGWVTVVDAGSGIGLLGSYALFSGVDECIFLEHNPHSLAYSKGLLKDLGYGDRCQFFECDATTFQLPKRYDLLISETITSGFVEEDFLGIVNNLRSFAGNNSIIIPELFEVTEIQKDKSSQVLKEKKIMIDSKLFDEVMLGNDFEAQASSVTYGTKTHLFKDISLESGQCMSFLNERIIRPD